MEEAEPREHQPRGAQTLDVTSSGDAGGYGAQFPDSALPDLIRFLDEHPEFKAIAKAQKVNTLFGGHPDVKALLRAPDFGE